MNLTVIQEDESEMEIVEEYLEQNRDDEQLEDDRKSLLERFTDSGMAY